MTFPRMLIPVLGICVACLGCSRGPSPEDTEKIAALRAELEQVRSEIVAAQEKNASLDGGLVKALVEARLEILKTTEALIQQRIQAMESGAKITIQVTGTEPDEELAARLQKEIESQLVELNNARAEAAKYSGGLIAAMKEATVSTQEQTIAMLRQRYLAAKYGLAMVPPSAAAGVESQEAIAPTSSSASQSTIAEPSEEIITVKILGKQYDRQEYQDFVWFDLELKADGLDKPARAIKGVLNLQDLFGEARMRINWTIDEPIEPGETIVEKGVGFEYNEFMDSHRWVLATDLNNMTAGFTVKSILYQDGTRLDF